ncbi:hypothetical protein LXA43DRAFT_968762 [Ganoderma leucocontextum]|nr:hypothetical protein LXA43DRAFT_968762 [Ganoderma leucocontextum]
MKRNSTLVEYPSSDEDQSTSPVPGPPPVKKLKKLPALGDHLQPQTPVDDPVLHQGRRRTTPHVEGQFAAYVYVPLLIPKQSQLYTLFSRIYAAAKLLVPSLHPIGFKETDILNLGVHPTSTSIELHISLTRPTYLRAHQREEFKRAVRSISTTRRKFSASFATFSELTNDERTRTFLALEIGAGHDDFKSLVQGLAPALRAIRQKEFYDDPRFHASIAWALLDGSKTPGSPLTQNDTPSESRQPALRAQDTAARSPSPGNPTTPTSIVPAPEFPTIPCFPQSLIPQLQAEFCSELVRQGVGTFEAEEVHVRIGKEISRWKLAE